MTAEFTGSLREHVAVEQWTAAPDSDGAWTAAGTAWAEIVPTDSAATPEVGERRTSRLRFRLTLRARSDIGLATRFRWGERILTVLRTEPDPRQPDRLTLLVEERT